MSGTLEFGGSGKVESVLVVFCTHSGLLLAKAVCAPQHARHDIVRFSGKNDAGMAETAIFACAVCRA